MSSGHTEQSTQEENWEMICPDCVSMDGFASEFGIN